MLCTLSWNMFHRSFVIQFQALILPITYFPCVFSGSIRFHEIYCCGMLWIGPSLSNNASIKNTFDPSISPSHTKVQQCVLLEVQQIMIEYDSPHDVDGIPLPKDRSVEAQRALRDSFNGWLTMNEDDRSKKHIWNVKILVRSAVLVEFDSPASKDTFVKICEDDLTHLKGLLTGGHIKPCT
jgi:hypothetical protein